MTTAEISLGEVERTINQHFGNLDLSGVELAISAYPAMIRALQPVNESRIRVAIPLVAMAALRKYGRRNLVLIDANMVEEALGEKGDYRTLYRKALYFEDYEAPEHILAQLLSELCMQDSYKYASTEEV